MDYPESLPNAGLVGGKFVDEDPVAGTPGSLIPSAWGNAVTDEIIAVIEAAGLTPNEEDSAQLVKAIRLLQQGAVGGYASDTGVANAYAATYAPAVSAMIDGMVLRFKAAAANTGAATFSPNGLAAKPIVNLKYAALSAGDIAAGGEVWLQYNSSISGGVWVSILNLSLTAASDTVAGIVELATQAETKALTDSQRAVTPASLKTLLAQIAPVSGSFSSLKASAGGTSAAVVVSADALVVVDADGIPSVLKALSLSINSASVGANGLDSGVLAASTWYSIWVIWNGTTTAGLLSLSATAPTMPSGYTHKARVGWIRTDATANKYPLGFIQAGRSVQYVSAAATNVPTLPILASGVAGSYSLTTITWVSVATASFIPPTAKSITLNVSRTRNTASAFASVALAPNANYQGNQSSNPGFFDQANVSSWGNIVISMLLESSNIYWASSAAGGALACAGWEDNL